MTLPDAPERHQPARWPGRYTGFATFTLGAGALSLPSGYSIGAVLLLLGSTLLLFTRPKLDLQRKDWIVIGALISYFAVLAFQNLLDGQGIKSFDSPSRYLLAVPALLLVMAYPPKLAWWWHGVALGGLTTGLLAAWQALVEGAGRATGLTQTIQYGNISLLLGLLCLAGLIWAREQRHRHLWSAWLLCGAMAGVLASLLSGSRGGWLAIVPVAAAFYWAYKNQFSLKLRLGCAAGVLLLVTAVYATPQLGVQQRVDAATSNIHDYLNASNRDTSVGLRFQMWQGAGQLFLEKPLLGWGEQGYRSAMRELALQGVISSRAGQFGHAHNEFMDTAAKRGIAGLAALLLLYVAPLLLFAQAMKSSSASRRALAMAGMVLPLAYISFGMSQAFMAHNSGVMVYAFWLAAIWGLSRRA